jgi:hypothetical protein
VIVKPMVDQWEIPRIERIATLEGRRIARFGVPGLAGDLQQDLGAGSLAVEISGSLQGDEARDAFLNRVREAFQAGEPVSFVADVVTATELEQVIIEGLELEEVDESAGSFRYLIRLRQYVEPPAPPTPIDDLGASLDASLDELAGLGLAGLELPGILADIPTLGDPMPPLREALKGVEAATAPLNELLSGLRSTLGA